MMQTSLNRADLPRAAKLSRFVVLHVLIAALVTLSFVQGVTMIAGLPESVSRAVIEAGGLVAFALVAALRPKRALRGFVLIAPLLALAVLGFLSALNNGHGVLAGALFIRQALGPTLLLAGGLALADDRRAVIGIALLGLALFFIQPFVGIIKLATIGVDEKHWIGTLHQNAGQLGLLLPMAAIAAAVPLALLSRPAVVLFVPLFVLFGIVGEKRAIVVMLPMMIVFMTAVTVVVAWVRLGAVPAFARGSLSARLGLPAVLAGSVLMAAAGGVLTIPSLNPAGTQGGGFKVISSAALDDSSEGGAEVSAPPQDPGDTIGGIASFAMRYVQDYLIRDFDHEMNESKLSVEENTNIQLGRGRIIVATFQAVASFETPQMLFGLGGSAISESYLLGEGRGDIMFRTLGLRGPTPLGLQLLVETGFVGLALVVAWFASIAVLLIRRLAGASSVFVVTVCTVALGWHATAFFDVFAYSTVFWTTGTLGISYAVLVGVALAAKDRPGSEGAAETSGHSWTGA